MTNLFKFIDTNLKWIALVIIALLSVFALRECNSSKILANENARLLQNEQILTGNITALNDTVRYWKDAEGNSISSIKILSANKEMMEGQFSELSGKYTKLVGKDSRNSDMIAYLATQIQIKDRAIEDLKSAGSKTGSRILNDSTVLVDIGKRYDTANYYQISGNIYTSIKDNKITAGKIDLTTTIGLGIEFGIDRDKHTGIAKITSKTAFPAKISLSGITQIENAINRQPRGYLGLAVFCGYGAIIQKQPVLAPMLGVGVYYSPSWLTIKLYNR